MSNLNAEHYRRQLEQNRNPLGIGHRSAVKRGPKPGLPQRGGVKARAHSPAGPVEREMKRTLSGAPVVRKKFGGHAEGKSDGTGKLAGPRAERLEAVSEAPVNRTQPDCARYLSGGREQERGSKVLVIDLEGAEPWEWRAMAVSLRKYWGARTVEDFEREAREFGFSDGSVRVLVAALREGAGSARGKEGVC